MSNTDNFIKASANGQTPVVATLTNTHTQGSGAFECDNLTGWADTAAFIVYETDSNGNPIPGSETSWVAEKNNKILQNAVLTSGADRNYPANKTMVVADYTAEAHNRLVIALLKTHNQDGTLKDIDGSKLKDNSIDGSKLKPSSVKPEHFDKLVWHDVNYENDFSALDSGGYQVPQYSKDAFGIVRLRGIAKHSQSNVTEKIIFRLPVGFRPAGAEIFATPNASSVGRVNINPDGGVTLAALHNPSSSYVSLSGISFQAA